MKFGDFWNNVTIHCTSKALAKETLALVFYFNLLILKHFKFYLSSKWVKFGDKLPFNNKLMNSRIDWAWKLVSWGSVEPESKKRWLLYPWQFTWIWIKALITSLICNFVLDFLHHFVDFISACKKSWRTETTSRWSVFRFETRRTCNTSHIAENAIFTGVCQRDSKVHCITVSTVTPDRNLGGGGKFKD